MPLHRFSHIRPTHHTAAETELISTILSCSQPIEPALFNGIYGYFVSFLLPKNIEFDVVPGRHWHKSETLPWSHKSRDIVVMPHSPILWQVDLVIGVREHEVSCYLMKKSIQSTCVALRNLHMLRGSLMPLPIRKPSYWT